MSGKTSEPEKKKAAVKESKPKSPKAPKADILSQVRQATLSDTEVQAIIDVLLLKQVCSNFLFLSVIGGRGSSVQKVKKIVCEQEVCRHYSLLKNRTCELFSL